MFGKYPTIRIISDQNIFQNIMDSNLISSDEPHSPQKNTSFPINQPPNHPHQLPLHQIISSLTPEDALTYLESLEQNSHQVLCQQAELYVKMQKYKLAFENCQKAIRVPSDCVKCVSLYLRLFEIFLPRKLSLLDLLLQKCDKGQIKNPQLTLAIKKIKQSQNMDQDYQEFLTDLQLGGAEFSKLSIFSQQSDNRSVITRAEIEKDQTILFIPKNKLILLDNARDSMIVKKIHQQKLYLKSPKHCQLAIFMLEQNEKGKQSAFWHYLNHLPKKFETFPINYKPQELQYLKGSPFLDQIEQKTLDMKRDYDAICNISPTFSKFSFQDFKKFRLIVSSRLFGICIGKYRTDAMVPLADMLNHHIPKQTSWYFSEQHDGFIIKSLKKIPKGSQIYDSYGQKCNSRFLLNYGFTIPDNEVNEVMIQIPFQYEEDDRIEIYRHITLRISKNIESKEFDEMIAILRHSVSRPSQSHQEWCVDSIKQTPFINLDIEAQIWQKLEKIVESQISDYPTTVKEDRKLLMSKDLSINYMNCIILRKGQKQILHFYLTMAKKMIRYIRSGGGQKGFQQLKEYECYLKQLNFS